MSWAAEVEEKQNITPCATPACRGPSEGSPMVPGTSNLCVHTLSHTPPSYVWRNVSAVPEQFWSTGRTSVLNSMFLWNPPSTEQSQKGGRKQHLFTALLTHRAAWVKSKWDHLPRGVWGHHHHAQSNGKSSYNAAAKHCPSKTGNTSPRSPQYL